MKLLGIRKQLWKPLFSFPRRKSLIPKTFLFPTITVSSIMWYCNSNSCVLVSVDGFLLHSKNRGMQWKGQLWAWQNTTYVILGKSFETMSKKGSRQHLQSITSGPGLLLQFRWRTAQLGNCLNLARRENNKKSKPLPNASNTHFWNFSSFSIRW